MRISFCAFKRMAANEQIALEMIERNGNKEIPERLLGKRRIVHVGAKKIVLLNADGVTSDLDIRSAKMFECDGEILTIYHPSIRHINDDEQAALDEWMQFQNEYMRNNPYGDPFWKKKLFFKDSKCPWMAGLETVCGRYFTNGMVMDWHIPGEVALKYRIYHLEASSEL